MKYYPTEQYVGGSVAATEHSVMCMGTYEDELGTFRRLITETYPHGLVSIVSDTWDLWKVLTDYLPTLKEDILARNGRVVIRPDSGDPVDIICGNKVDAFGNWKNFQDDEYKNVSEKTFRNICESKGAYELLWDTFGGTINEKGYKVLNPKVGLIYGDSITLERQKQILSQLEAKGFSASNLVLGIGSFTYEYVTRDCHGFAMKATYGEIIKDGETECREIWKDPITDDGMKKSAKGLLQVKNGILKDQCTWEEEAQGDLRVVFDDGKLLIDESLTIIRERLLS
jgi:nicotinamide phosphoribosyltransferase